MAYQDAQQPQHQATFTCKRNQRNHVELFVKGWHISLPALKEQMQKLPNKPDMLKYLSKDIPYYPNPVEFEVSNVSHVTNESGILGILESGGFNPPASEYSWWHLKVNEKEITLAEERYVQAAKLNKEQKLIQKPFLEKFLTSPAFKDESRYGNYRFTFPFADLIGWYKEMNCGGKDPVLRVFKTSFFKQEIMYAVVIHSPEYNQQFKDYPLLQNSEWLSYQSGKIIWKAQAICETHKYTLVLAEVQESPYYFYVWDQVGLAFYLPKITESYKALTPPTERLRDALQACELDKIDLSRYKGPLTTEQRYENAKLKVAEEKKKSFYV